MNSLQIRQTAIYDLDEYEQSSSIINKPHDDFYNRRQFISTIGVASLSMMTIGCNSSLLNFSKLNSLKFPWVDQDLIDAFIVFFNSLKETVHAGQNVLAKIALKNESTRREKSGIVRMKLVRSTDISTGKAVVTEMQSLPLTIPMYTVKEYEIEHFSPQETGQYYLFAESRLNNKKTGLFNVISSFL